MATRTEAKEEQAITANQFWGAIKIYTEKPHVINRRICGTTNLWIGVCEGRDYDRERVLTSVLSAIETEGKEERICSKDQDFTKVLSATETDDGKQRIGRRWKGFASTLKANAAESETDETEGETARSGLRGDETPAEGDDVIGETLKRIDGGRNGDRMDGIEIERIDKERKKRKMNEVDLESDEEEKNKRKMDKIELEKKDEERNPNFILLRKVLEEACFKSLSEYETAKLEDDGEVSEAEENDGDDDVADETECGMNETAKDDDGRNETAMKGDVVIGETAKTEDYGGETGIETEAIKREAVTGGNSGNETAIETQDIKGGKHDRDETGIETEGMKKETAENGNSENETQDLRGETTRIGNTGNETGIETEEIKTKTAKNKDNKNETRIETEQIKSETAKKKDNKNETGIETAKNKHNKNETGIETAKNKQNKNETGNETEQTKNKTSKNNKNNKSETGIETGRHKVSSPPPPPPPHSKDGGGQLSVPWRWLAEVRRTVVVVAVVRKILPKRAEKFAAVLEVVLLDGSQREATYISEVTQSGPSITPKVPYTLALTPAGPSLAFLGEVNKEEGDPSVTWLTKIVLPKVTKWAVEVREVTEGGGGGGRGSLRLVDVGEYNQEYQRLKVKYGKALVKIWPEVTDPLKFVYEDIAIAAYLILLWRSERRRRGLGAPQSFVDLGCGNGLLVYILSGEGHRGLGVDVKRRKIWDLFPSHVELKEATIEPSDKHLFPDHDWLIGNHSDELTPWIPVIAAKSGYDTRFLLIPCCAFDFNQKYRRRHAGRSQYADYLEYVKEICVVCGYDVKQDRLRIPSTKRQCLVGSERTMDSSAYSKVSATIDAFIKSRTDIAAKELSDGDAKRHAEASESGDRGGVSGVGELWTGGFKARESVQPVRNCTQLKRGVKEDIISAIVSVLMEKKCLVEITIPTTTTTTTTTTATTTWDRGGSMTLGGLARRLPPPLLAAMKKECGGLQTLLKNHRYIFSLSDGLVCLRVPQPALTHQAASNSFAKTKLCWFHTHHRSGCPLPAPLCLYAHGEQDLRRKEERVGC